ncbi:MAG: tetratricopeptide repeat protein [Candidatus Aminicenantaceae bacterium]
MKIAKTAAVIFLTALLCTCASKEKKVEKEREQNPQYQYNIGIFYLNNGQPDEAIKYLEKSLVLLPEFDLALDGMGLAQTMKGNFEEAIKYYNQCLIVNPTLTDAHNHLGSVYQEIGMLTEAEDQFLAAVADEAYHSRELPLYNLARLYYIQDKNEQAMQYTDRALSINRRLAMAHNLRGLIFERLERYPDAIGGYQDALRIIPEDINLTYNLAGAFFKDKNYVKAKELFTKLQARVLDPDMKANIIRYLEMIDREIR